MLELFLKLVDRIIDLVNATHVRQRAQFTEVAQPLFQSLEPVANDYFSLFNSASNALQNGELDAESIRNLRNARVALEPARIKVRAMAAAIRRQPSLTPLHNFAESVKQFFYFSEVEPYQTYSIGRELIDVMEFLHASDVEHRDAKIYIDATAERLKQRWSAVVAAYSELQIAAATRQPV